MHILFFRDVFLYFHIIWVIWFTWRLKSLFLFRLNIWNLKSKKVILWNFFILIFWVYLYIFFLRKFLSYFQSLGGEKIKTLFVGYIIITLLYTKFLILFCFSLSKIPCSKICFVFSNLIFLLIRSRDTLFFLSKLKSKVIFWWCFLLNFWIRFHRRLNLFVFLFFIIKLLFYLIFCNSNYFRFFDLINLRFELILIKFTFQLKTTFLFWLIFISFLYLWFVIYHSNFLGNFYCQISAQLK